MDGAKVGELEGSAFERAALCVARGADVYNGKGSNNE